MIKIFIAYLLSIFFAIFFNLASGNVQLASKIYQELAKTQEENFLVSPFSLQSALALVHEGATDETAEELKTNVHFKNVNSNEPLVPNLQGNENYNLVSANKIYVKDGFSINPNYKNKILEYYKGEIETANFNNPNEASKTINSWVEKKTNNKIKDLVNPSVINDYTKLILINAIYFKAKWNNQFPQYATIEQTFHKSKEEKVQVDTMHITSSFKYFESTDLDAKFLELPFKTGNDNVTMTIVLPNKIDGLSELEKSIDKVLTIPELTDQRVKVSLPKFTIETELKLANVLKQLGVSKLFTASADLSGIGDSESLSVSEVVQKTFIKVSEEGTEAAAATASSAAPDPSVIRFNANHPFLFYIKANDVILFEGRVVDPK